MISTEMPPPIPAPRRDGMTHTTAVPLYWREDGPPDAPALVLLHGGPGAHHDYLYPQMLELAKTHRVITYDQRGGGRSRSDDREPVTWETQVRDLAQVIAEFELDAPTIVGYSWGALLAMLYAAHARDIGAAIPSRLVLISPAPIQKRWRDQYERELSERAKAPVIMAARAELAASGLRENDATRYRQRNFELSVAGYFADAARATALTPFRVTARVQQSIWQSLGDYDLTDALKALHVSTLIVHGRQDPIPVESARAAADALHARLVVIDDCGHVPYVEQPRALFSAIEAFLATGHAST